MQKSFTLYEKLVTLMVLSLVIAVHGLSHLGLENSYKFLV
jgi:competence protein ComGC